MHGELGAIVSQRMKMPRRHSRNRGQILGTHASRWYSRNGGVQVRKDKFLSRLSNVYDVSLGAILEFIRVRSDMWDSIASSHPSQPCQSCI